MIAVGDRGEDAQLLDRALADRQVLMAPVVLTEIPSDPKLPSSVAQTLSELPLVEISPGAASMADFRCLRETGI